MDNQVRSEKMLLRAEKVSSLLIQAQLASTRPHASSNKSERNHHQIDFKNNLVLRYERQGSDLGKLRCMVLNVELPRDQITAAHIIGIKERNVLQLLGLADDFLWSDKNGILVFKELEDAKEKFEVVCSTAYIFTFHMDNCIPSPFTLISHSFPNYYR
jgi:hypothetical protein